MNRSLFHTCRRLAARLFLVSFRLPLLMPLMSRLKPSLMPFLPIAAFALPALAAAGALLLAAPPDAAAEAGAALEDLSAEAAIERLKDTGAADAARLPPGRLAGLQALQPLSAPGASASEPAAGTRRFAPLEDDAGIELCLFLSTSVPEASLRAIAEEAAALGLPLVFSSLPMKPEPLWRARQEALAAGLEWKGPWRPPASVDAGAVARLLAPLAQAGAAIEIDPLRWRLAERALRAASAPGSADTRSGGAGLLPVPALVLFSPQAIEVFPGDVRPLYAMSYARLHAETPALRRAVERRLAKRGLLEAAERLVP